MEISTQSKTGREEPSKIEITFGDLHGKMTCHNTWNVSRMQGEINHYSYKENGGVPHYLLFSEGPLRNERWHLTGC